MAFRDAVVAALEGALGKHLDAVGDVSRHLGTPPKAEQGDIAFPCFTLAKVLKQAPPKIAAELAAKIEAGGPIKEVRALGPFLNFFSDPGHMLQDLAASIADGRFEDSLKTDAPQRVMIEYSQPNTHKTFHVGHLRNVCLGDALVRVLTARGHDVVPANYYGDFGIDVAKCLWWLDRNDMTEPPATGRTAWLGEAYAAATAAITPEKNDDEEAKARKDVLRVEVREVLRSLEEQEEPFWSRYRETRQWCLDEFKDVYRWLGAEFEHDFFESELEEAGQAVVDEYLKKGVFEESRGAIICDLEDVKLVPALVRKSDGASLYMTWDLALAKAKFDQFGIERSMYVVAAEQNLHFQQLFATLRKMGYERAEDCRHVSYQLVMLPEGKMSSRKGTAIPFHLLRSQVLDAIESKMREEDRADRADWDDAAYQDVANRVAVACLKYGMLRVGNSRQVIFKLEDWTSPEGDTGAYLLYSLARIGGILRKAEAAGAELPGLDTTLPDVGEFGAESERALLTHLITLPKIVERVEASDDPSHIANFLYEGARRFSRFYGDCPVLKADDATRAARLLLARVTKDVMSRALDLLGIPAVEAM